MCEGGMGPEPKGEEAREWGDRREDTVNGRPNQKV